MEPDFLYLNDVIPDAIIDLRYASDFNFVGKRIDGYLSSRPSLSRPAAEGLAAAAEDFRRLGYRILVFDAYRPQRAVDHFIRWSLDPNDLGNPSFYKGTPKNEIFAKGFLSKRSAHSRGSAVDITIVHPDGSPVDMGGGFDWFMPVSYTECPDITDEQRANRRLLAKVVTAHGFKSITTEWWHFKLIDEPYPDTFFDFPVQ